MRFLNALHARFFRRAIWLGSGLLIFAAFSPLGILQNGLTTAEPVGAFVNNVFPATTPGQGTGAWILESAFPGLSFFRPMHLAQEPGTDTLWIAEKRGNLYAFSYDGNTVSTFDVLDISAVTFDNSEGGLLGFDFHPAYPDSNYVYIYYTFNGNGVIHDRLSRFTVDQATHTAQPASELVLINQYDRAGNHNGGSVFFGNDGFLYLGLGDEGGSNNQWGTAQVMNERLFAGLLRIDVDCDSAKSHPIRRQPIQLNNHPNDNSYTAHYMIPNDNPFLDSAGTMLEEYYAIGLRNPYRTMPDPVTGLIWTADVGQNAREEVNLIEAGGNYEWAFQEGLTNGPDAMPGTLYGTVVPPIYDYAHQAGNNCIIGGGVYRGTQHLDLYGRYLFADRGSGRLWSMSYNIATGANVVELDAFGQLNNGITSFAQTDDGEILILAMNGDIYRLARQGAGAPEPPDSLSQVGAFTDLVNLTPADFMVPYTMRVPFWSDNAYKYRWMMLPNDGTHDSPGEKIGYTEEGHWTFPEGAVLVKHFEYPIDDTDPTITRRLETRFSIKGSDGIVYGVTYRWREDQTDAYLLSQAQIDTLSINTANGPRTFSWYFPGRNDCSSCHNQASGGVLGPNTRQLNCDNYYPLTAQTGNQLTTYGFLEMFDSPPDTNNLGALLMAYEKDNLTASLEDRARSYLDANCSSCHQPGTGVQANFDARLRTPLDSQNLVYATAYNSLGIHDARLIIPGDLEHSTLYHRLNEVHNAAAMPPLSKNLVDSAGVALIADWISNMDPAWVANGQTHQRIDFAPLGRRLSTDPPFNLAASSTSGLPITYTIVSGPATLTGNQVTLTGAEGEVVVRAQQAGSATYAAAPEIERSFWVADAGRAEGTGLLAHYFQGSDPNTGTMAFSRVDSVIDFYWGSDRPDISLGYDQFSVAWKGMIEPPTSGSYTFITTTDDGVRLWVDGQLIIDQWQDQAASKFSGSIALTAWQRVPIRLEYYERDVYAEASLRWRIPGRSEELVPSVFLYPNYGSPLSAEDASFSASLEGDEVALRWEWQGEVAAARYLIERALDGESFGQWREVTAQGARTYQLMDPQPYPGLSHYRLRIIGQGGNEVYREVASVRLGQAPATMQVRVFPNPLNETRQLTLEVQTDLNLPVQVALYDLNGRLQRRLKLTGGAQRSQRVDLRDLPAGVYLLHCHDGQTRHTQRVMLR
jgi:uncharacterized repeat protein (TIGR03806 family)